MPWRKRYDPGLSMEEKGQRAYEVRTASACQSEKYGSLLGVTDLG